MAHRTVAVDCGPTLGEPAKAGKAQADTKARAIYTAQERARRDATVWTTVQAILAPIQFLVFLVSLGFVLFALLTDSLHGAAAISVLVKTGLLYTIMITGAIWERVVFGQYLFAPAFFWEDVVSFLVIALHTAYLVVYFAGVGTPSSQLVIALAAYGAYAINAAQFLIKMAMAKRAERDDRTAGLHGAAA